MIWQRSVHAMWVKENRRAGWHLHGDLICLIKTCGVGEKTTELRAVADPWQNTSGVTGANDTETAVV